MVIICYDIDISWCWWRLIFYLRVIWCDIIIFVFIIGLQFRVLPDDILIWWFFSQWPTKRLFCVVWTSSDFEHLVLVVCVTIAYIDVFIIIIVPWWQDLLLGQLSNFPTTILSVIIIVNVPVQLIHLILQQLHTLPFSWRHALINYYMISTELTGYLPPEVMLHLQVAGDVYLSGLLWLAI